jgi:Domain of unknown function (DUF6249)
MNTPNTLPDALIVIALAGAFVAWIYLRHRERQRRLEVVHQERLVAIDKGIPLPEWPSEPLKAPADPRAIVIHGLAWVALGLGSMVALWMSALQVGGTVLWPLPLPLFLLGVGLILYYVLVARSR